MKTFLILTVLFSTLTTSPAIIPSRVRVPVPKVAVFSKKTQKFLSKL